MSCGLYGHDRQRERREERERKREWGASIKYIMTSMMAKETRPSKK